MNLDIKWVFAGLSLLAFACMAPTATATSVDAGAHVQVPLDIHVCVYDPFTQGSIDGVFRPHNGCGGGDAHATVSGPLVGCVTTSARHPTSGC